MAFCAKMTSSSRNPTRGPPHPEEPIAVKSSSDVLAVESSFSHPFPMPSPAKCASSTDHDQCQFSFANHFGCVCFFVGGFHRCSGHGGGLTYNTGRGTPGVLPFPFSSPSPCAAPTMRVASSLDASSPCTYMIGTVGACVRVVSKCAAKYFFPLYLPHPFRGTVVTTKTTSCLEWTSASLNVATSHAFVCTL